MNTYKFYIIDLDQRFCGPAVFFRDYKNFSVAQATLTKTVKKFVRVFGHYPDKYGVETYAINGTKAR